MKCASFLMLLLLSAATTVSAAQPNIIHFLADDLGYGELGCYGQAKIKTPHLDQLAADGLRFTQFYAGHAVCAPSRCALLTGKHTGHTFVRENSEGRDAQKEERERIKKEDGYFSQIALPAREVTVAEILKQSGYRTACIGKWGLGHPSNEGSPLRQGFDFFYGYISQYQAHNHYPTYLWRNGRKEPLTGNDGISAEGKQYAADRCEDEALQFIRAAKPGEPFFLYYATPVPHVALQVPEDEPSLAGYRSAFAASEVPYDGKKGYLAVPDPRARYAAMVTRMDRTIGKIRALLKETGQSDNTLIVFTSDNGATFNGGYDRDFFEGNKPLRGMKTELWDGGIRVPCIAAWPGTIKPGQTSGYVGASWDFLPTYAELAGAAIPAGLDGQSIVPTLLGGRRQPSHEVLYWETVAGGHQALRVGDWKALRLGAAQAPDAPVQLFNLATDPGETTDVAASHPDIITKATALLKSSRFPSPEFPMGLLDQR
jgi:arylsulfatase